jgi:hypothetical protein
MRDFIENTPGAADAIITLMQGGMPQAQAQQMVANQMSGQQPDPYNLQQPQMDPGINFLLEQVAGMQAQLESRDFSAKYPQADVNEVARFMQQNELPTLEAPYRVMTYDDLQRQTAAAQDNTAVQRQGTAVMPGAQGPPTQQVINPRDLTPEQMSEVAKRYNLIE